MVELAIKTSVKPEIVVAYEVFEICPDFGDSNEEVNLLVGKIEKSKNTTCYRSPEGDLVSLRRVKDMNVQVTNFLDRDLPPKMN